LEGLLQRAVDAGSVEVLERLLVVKKEVQAGRARDAFYEALTAFQAHCPVIGKNTEASVQSRTGASFKYRYTPLEDIAHAIRPLLEQYALGYRWFVKQDASKQLTVTCRISHILGHIEESSLTVPIGDDPQRPAWPVAQSLTYAKRYTLCNALGIVVGGEDDDAHEVVTEASATQHAHKTTPPPPAGADPHPTPSGAHTPTIEGVIEDVLVKEGTTKGKPWTRYGIVLGNQTYGTFDKELGREALERINERVVLHYEQDGKYLTCTGIGAPLWESDEREPGSEGYDG